VHTGSLVDLLSIMRVWYWWYCSHLVGDDCQNTFMISGTEVVISASRVSASMQPLQYSTQVSMWLF